MVLLGSKPKSSECNSPGSEPGSFKFSRECESESIPQIRGCQDEASGQLAKRVRFFRIAHRDYRLPLFSSPFAHCFVNAGLTRFGFFASFFDFGIFRPDFWWAGQSLAVPNRNLVALPLAISASSLIKKPSRRGAAKATGWRSDSGIGSSNPICMCCVRFAP